MKSESEINFYPFFKVSSINNNINPSVDILIESIDRFSFGEDIEDEKNNQKLNSEEKNKKLPPNNYSFIKSDNSLTESNQKFKDLNNIINNILEIKLPIEENKNKGKICGLFNKEDFDLKDDNNKKKKHKNNQLNDSFEKNYSNPLKKILDDEESEKDNDNANKDLPIQKKEDNKTKNEKEERSDKNNKVENLEQKNIINEINNDIDKNLEVEENIKNNIEPNQENNINVNNSNSNLKINNYDADDDKENEQKIKEISNSDTEIPFIGDLIPFKNKEKEPTSATNSQEIPKISIENEKDKDIDLPINKNEIDNNKIININNFDNINNDGYESPRLGGNFIEEEKEEIKDIIDEIKEKNPINSEEEKIILVEEKEKGNKDDDLNKKNEHQMNLPLSLNLDNPLLNSNNKDISKNNQNKKDNQDKIINNNDINSNADNKENKDNNIKKKKEKNLNMNLAELKANSFIIINTSSKINKDSDSEEKNKKIIELTQKLEQTEKDAQMIKEKNEKLLEVINAFKNLQTLEQKKPPNSGKNSRRDTPKGHLIKKRCFTPTLSKTNKLYNKIQAPAPYHKRSNSYNKIRISNNQFNENRLYIDYIPFKQKTYRELHGRENNKRKEKKNNQINNKNTKSYGNYINRNTIYLTGSSNSKYLKSPYLNNNMNYTGISYSNGFNNFNKYNNSFNDNIYMNNSSQSFYVNNNANNKIDDNFRNIYQRQVMQMPPNEQPLFYETKSNLNINNNIYQELVYNNKISYNSENKYRNNNIKEKNNKYIQEKPYNYNNNSHDMTYNNIKKRQNNNNKNQRQGQHPAPSAEPGLRPREPLLRALHVGHPGHPLQPRHGGGRGGQLGHPVGRDLQGLRVHAGFHPRHDGRGSGLSRL